MLLVADSDGDLHRHRGRRRAGAGRKPGGGSVAAIGSGGNYALAAGQGLDRPGSEAEEIARKAMAIAAEICVYTNGNLTVESL
jgi:ATP-dependent HslUV protease subunit HslV